MATLASAKLKTISAHDKDGDFFNVYVSFVQQNFF